MKKEIKYQFWIWSNKLNPILNVLAQLTGYAFSEGEKEAIKISLQGTNDEMDIWSDWEMRGNFHAIKLKMAYDDEEGSNMIHLNITTPSELKTQIETLDLIQAMFSELVE